tara:strand:- start:100 stop:507 length:408 start_codon:yes stop_codon:yes gene_type:complete
MKMKNITTMLVKGMLLVSFMYAGTVGPTLSMRFNDLLAVDNALPTPDVVLGLEASMGDGIFAGVESEGANHRLYVKMGYGTFGMGLNADNEARFTIGGNYSVLDRFSVNLDYIINQALVTTPDEDQLRITLKVDF